MGQRTEDSAQVREKVRAGLSQKPLPADPNPLEIRKMKIEIIRDAVCAADDNLGPLMLEVDVTSDDTIEDVINKIKKSKFLQFSSSQTSITGYINNVAFAKLHDEYNSKKPTEFYVSPDSRFLNMSGYESIEFRFKKNF